MPFLTDDLERIAHTGRHRTGIQDGLPCREDVREARLLEDQRVPIPDKIAQKKNWMQDIFTPSTIGEKWSMTVIWIGEQQRTTDR